jgi:hypothetical protein
VALLVAGRYWSILASWQHLQSRERADGCRCSRAGFACACWLYKLLTAIQSLILGGCLVSSCTCSRMLQSVSVG